MRIDLLRTLGADGEALLRLRAEEKGRDPARSLRQMGNALAAGKLCIACLYDDSNRPQGIAAWRWADPEQSHAQVLMVYTPRAALPEPGESLVHFVFSELTRDPALEVIEARMRDLSPGVREAWQQHDLALFERCRMMLPLGQLPLPVVPTPGGYAVKRWADEHQAQAEQIAARARDKHIDAVAVPDTRHIAEHLHQYRLGVRSGVDAWNASASFVALDRRGKVVGYVANAVTNGEALIPDLAVDAAHRRRGLARLLMIRSMQICLKQGLSAIRLAVTTRNPVRHLYNQLGFQTTDCGEIAIWWRDGRQLEWRDDQG